MADVYQIGISIAMQNGVSAVLGIIQKDLLKLNSAVTQAAAGFGRLKLAIAGATGVVLGGAVLKGIYDLTRDGEKYTHQLELMKVAGMQVAEVQAAIASANKVSSTVLTTTPTENLQTIRELRMALASADVRPGGVADPAMATKEAVAHLETFQKISGIMSSVLSKEGVAFNGAGQAYELAKAAEMLGLTQNPAKFDTVLEGWTKAIIASGGKLQGSDIFANVKYLRGAGLGMDMQFLTETLPSLAQEFKTGGGRSGGGAGQGGGAGNPLASLFAEIVGGQINNKAVKALESIDMINMAKVHETTTGRVKMVDPGAVRGSDVAATNLYKFVTDYLEPAIRKHTSLLDRNAEGDLLHPGEFRGFLAAIAQNRTAQQVLGMMLSQQSRIAGDTALMRSSFGVDKAFTELVRHDPDLVRKAMGEQWDRLKTDLGKAITPQVTEMVYRLATALRFLSEIIEAHPVATKWILTIIAGLAGMIVVVGGLALAVAAFAAIGLGGWWALIPAALIAIGGAFGYLNDKLDIVGHVQQAFAALVDSAFWHRIGAMAMTGIYSVWAVLGDIVQGTVARLGTIASSVWTSITGVWTALTDSLANLVKSLATWFASLPSRIMAAITGAVIPSATAGPTDRSLSGTATMPTMRITPPPPSATDSRGTASAPLHVFVTNQTSGADIANGVTTHQARSLSGPRTGLTGFDSRTAPSLTYMPVTP